jgi:hypothetical protein
MEKKKSFLSKIAITSEQIFVETKTYLQRVYNTAGSQFSSSSPFGQIVKVLSNYYEHLFFYLEDAQAENHPYTASSIEAIYGNSQLAGHNPTRGMSATGEVRFKFKSGKETGFPGPYIILNDGIKLKCNNNNLTYTLKFNTDQIRISKNSSEFIYANIQQGIFETQKLIGTGNSMQTYNLNIVGTTDHINVKVFVNGKLWQQVESIYDMPGRDKEVVMVRTGLVGGIDLIFGNGYFGKVVPFGATIEVQYLITAGSSGTIYANTGDIAFEFLDSGAAVTGDEIDLNEFMIMEAVTPPRMGADREDYNFTKFIAPLASKSFVLAGPVNYEYFLSRYNSYSYIDAFNTVDDDYLDDDNVTYLFILPDVQQKLTSDLDYFNLPITEFTLDTVEKNAIKRAIRESGQQATTSEVQFVDPEIKKYALNIILRYFDGYNKDSINTEIRTKLNDYFLSVKRRDRIPKSDIIAIIETVAGIDSVNVYFISEENETAIKNGYYIKQTYKVSPTTPFLQEGEGTKKRFVFFNKELIETKIMVEPGKDPMLGLDEFGDIVIGHNQLTVIRGGWVDRYNTYYQEYPTKGQPSSLSIYFKEKIEQTLNTQVQTANRKKLG